MVMFRNKKPVKLYGKNSTKYWTKFTVPISNRMVLCGVYYSSPSISVMSKGIPMVTND